MPREICRTDTFGCDAAYISRYEVFMENTVIAVGAADCGTSPIMPYVGERFDGKIFTVLAKRYLSAALLRCGFDVLDPANGVCDAQDLMIAANRHTVSATVVVSYTAFGSRKSFNDIRGSVVRYSQGRFGARSRVLCEDICAKLGMQGKSSTASDGALGAANCPTAVIDAGYITYFDEAKMLYDPDFAVETGEHIAMGVCEHFGMPYIRRDDILSYPLLCSAATGKRGKKIKMLQALLCANGYAVDMDGIFGKNTDYAVKTFCINNGLHDCDGVSAAVWRDLLLLNPPRLEYGTKHNAVLYIQRKLTSKLYKTPLSATLDEDTLTAVNEFLTETESGLRATKSGGVTEEIFKLIHAVGGGRPRLF